MRRRQFAAALGALPLAGRQRRPGSGRGRRLADAHRAHRLPVHARRLAGQYRAPAGRQARRRSLGQSFVIDNRSGAGGSIAADNVAKSTPDGYSVLLGSIGSHALVPHLYAKPPYNPFTDLETVAGSAPSPTCCAAIPAFRTTRCPS